MAKSNLKASFTKSNLFLNKQYHFSSFPKNNFKFHPKYVISVRPKKSNLRGFICNERREVKLKILGIDDNFAIN